VATDTVGNLKRSAEGVVKRGIGQQQMVKQDMKPYDEAILKLAVTTLHAMLTLPVFEHVVRVKLWDKPTPDLDLR
jgi:hypothetical protein